ncbi:MAG: thiamine pyrophosphate-binding protein [Deltaproteobacteria bacterium]|nr:thiamine pyrophosphate-binding protein [Deltaproteobacteria bacterium]MBW2220335.1 thiamine pyrophosphate-binding protein [Deltaproteobacteria bacterium]
MSQIYGGHLVAKYLKEIELVDTVFTISGGHIENILDGFTEYNIRTIDVRHEQAAAMMAHAWSIYKNEPGVCLVTAGPGFTNALTGIVNAYLDNAPLVVLCGRHPLRDDLKGALQEMNQIDMVKPVTKWSATCFETKRIPEYLSIAFRQAVMGRPGPVFLELPPDILFVQIDEETVDMPARKVYKPSAHPEDSELQEAARLINEAQKPLLVGGSGVGMSDCGDVLKTFIEKTGVPFSLLNNGRGHIPDDHPLSINDGGFNGVMSGLPQADVVIAAGIRFNWVLQSTHLFPQAKVVRIDIDPYEIDRNRSSEVGLTGDCGDVFSRLTPMVQERDHSTWLGRLRNAYKAFMVTELEKRSTPSDPIHPIRLVNQIMEVFGQDAFYVADGGDTSYYGFAGFTSSLKAGVQIPAGALLGCLGTGIPFAMAAKLANPDKPVIVLNGDGSFGFNSMEFDTAVRHNIPIICVVNNDCAWGMIKHSQAMSIGADRCTCAELGMRQYEKMVEGLGGYGELVTKDEDIIPAIKRAVDSGKPACINVVTDPTVTSPATVMFYQNLSDF